MTKLKEDIAIPNKLKSNSLLDLLHVNSSTFPTGGFNHSFGLETFIDDEIIKKAKDMVEILKYYIEFQYKYTEGFSLRLIYQILNKYNFSKNTKILDEIIIIAKKISAQSLPYETHQGLTKIGKRSIETLLSIYPNKILKWYQKKTLNNEIEAHSVIAYGIIYFFLEVDLKEAIESFTFMGISTLIQNAVRAIPLGPSDSMYIHKEISNNIRTLYNEIMKLTEDEFGINSVGIEAAQMRHEWTISRLFMS